MARPWNTITSIESHKTSGGAWTRIPYIGRASVGRVVVKSHFHVNRKRKEMILPETSMYKHVMRAMCFGPPSTKVFSHLLKKKYNRADLAGGECFWADALW